MPKTIIVNAYTGPGWYERGQQRLVDSVRPYVTGSRWIDTIAQHDIMRWPHRIKAIALQHELERYSDVDVLCWLDCSAWATEDPFPHIERLAAAYGVVTAASGYNARETCNDRCLEYYGITADEAEEIPDCGSGLMIFDLRQWLGRNMLKSFIEDCLKHGISNGSRFHDNQSTDPRFKFHRQDQSVMSCLMHKYQGGVQIKPGWLYQWGAGLSSKQSVFKFEGM